MDPQDAAPVTKGDLKELATKADLEKLATKAEIQEVRRSLAIEIVNVGARSDRQIEELRNEMRETKSAILTQVDGFMAQSQKVDRDQIITHYRIDELDKRVKNLETH